MTSTSCKSENRCKGSNYLIREAYLDDIPEIIHNAKEIWSQTTQKLNLNKAAVQLADAISDAGGYVIGFEGRLVGCVIFNTWDNWWADTWYLSNLFLWIDSNHNSVFLKRKLLTLCKKQAKKFGLPFYYETFRYNGEGIGLVTRGRIIGVFNEKNNPNN